MFKVELPVVDLRAFSNANFAFGSLFSFVMGVGLYGLTYLYPLYLGRIRGYDSLMIGETMFVSGAAMFLTAPVAVAGEARMCLFMEIDVAAEKTRLGKMSKHGDAYLRSLTIQGAHAVLRQLRPDSQQPDDQRLQRWINRLGRKEAAVRLANRNLRILWVLLQNDQTYRRQPGNGQEATMSH